MLFASKNHPISKLPASGSDLLGTFSLVQDADPDSNLVAFGEGELKGMPMLVALYEFDGKGNAAAPDYKGLIVESKFDGSWDGKRLGTISLWVKEGKKCVASGVVELADKTKFNTFLMPPKDDGEAFAGFIVEKKEFKHPEVQTNSEDVIPF